MSGSLQTHHPIKFSEFQMFISIAKTDSRSFSEHQVGNCCNQAIALKTLPVHTLLMLASPRRFAVVPILRHGRPSPWANTESSRITVAECFGFQIWIIANWRCKQDGGTGRVPLHKRRLSLWRAVVLSRLRCFDARRAARCC